MQAKSRRNIRDGKEYTHLFPKAKLEEITIQRNANVSHTVKFIPQAVRETLFHTENICSYLKRYSVKDTCRVIWDFVYHHIAYKKDEEGKEQVRSPARAWHDRFTGVDCDCYTVFISSILSNLNIPHKLRIAKYSADHFQHIYPVVPLPSGEYITIDCVVDDFNYEEPYTEKKDFEMDLNYLNGVPEKQSMDSMEEESGLGRLLSFLKKKNSEPPIPSPAPKKESKLKTILKKTVNVVNKVNPATVLLRGGILAAMKINAMKIAQRIKYGYLTDQQAQQRGIDMVKFQKLKQVKDKLEKIFYAAGGTTANLKEAILTGKGNVNREVSLSGIDSGYDISVMKLNQNSPIEKVIGQEVYYSEFMEGNKEISGLNGLGEPVTATAVAAASGVLASIAALLKNIGNLFPKKVKGSEDFENTTEADKEAEKVNSSEEKVDLEKVEEELQQENKTRSVTTDSSDSETDPGAESSNTPDPTIPPPEPGFWEKNKKWLKPTLWGTGIATALGIGYAALKPKAKEKKQADLQGVKTKKKPPKKTSPKKQKFKTITLK
jgi:hypothetical protein